MQVMHGLEQSVFCSLQFQLTKQKVQTMSKMVFFSKLIDQGFHWNLSSRIKSVFNIDHLANNLAKVQRLGWSPCRGNKTSNNRCALGYQRTSGSNPLQRRSGSGRIFYLHVDVFQSAKYELFNIPLFCIKFVFNH